MFNKKKLKYGSASVVFIILFIGVIIIVNLMASFMTDRFSFTFDMTGAGLFDLSGETITSLAALTEPVEIIVMDSEDFTYTNQMYAGQVNEKYLTMFPELINRYRSSANDMITITYLDPVRNPTAAEQYKDLGDISVTDVIVKSARRGVILSSVSFFELGTNTASGQSYQYVSGLKFEQKLTSAVSFVTSEDIPKALFIKGHQEIAPEAFKTLMNDANYETGEITLLTENIPDDVDNLVIVAPQSDFHPDEIIKLDDFMMRGGNLFVFYDPRLGTLDTLDRYLAEWGVAYKRDLVLAEENSLRVPYEFLGIIPSTDMTASVYATDMPFYSYMAGAIEILWENNEWRDTYSILNSPRASFTRPVASVEANATFERTSEDNQGPFNMAVLTRRDDPNVDYQSNMLIASLSSISDDVLNTPTFINANYYGALLSYITPNNDAVIVTPKVYSSPRIIIEKWQADIITWIITGILPLGFIACGAVVWFRRRNR